MLEQALGMAGVVWEKPKVQCISQSINDIKDETHINGITHGLLTNPCLFQDGYIIGFNLLRAQGQFLQIAQHRLEFVVDGSRPKI